MCLNVVKEKGVVYEQDTNVYGVYRKDDLNRTSIRESHICEGVNTVPLRLRKEIRCYDENRTYRAGYHRFLSLKDARAFVKDYQYVGFENLVIVKDIIPKGTVVTIGEQIILKKGLIVSGYKRVNLTVYVSPTIIHTDKIVK